jgi:hypothetical protein
MVWPIDMKNPRLASWLVQHGIGDFEAFKALLRPALEARPYAGRYTRGMILYNLYSGRHVPGIVTARLIARALAARGHGREEALLWELSSVLTEDASDVEPVAIAVGATP